MEISFTILLKYLINIFNIELKYLLISRVTRPAFCTQCFIVISAHTSNVPIRYSNLRRNAIYERYPWNSLPEDERVLHPIHKKFKNLGLFDEQKPDLGKLKASPAGESAAG